MCVFKAETETFWNVLMKTTGISDQPQQTVLIWDRHWRKTLERKSHSSRLLIHSVLVNQIGIILKMLQQQQQQKRNVENAINGKGHCAR